MNVEEHYSMLLGLTFPWTVVLVEMNMERLRIDVYVEWRGEQGRCPVCGEATTGYDHLPEQTWRHLDTMQFETIVHCRLPRVQCAAHGVKTLKAPWGNGRGFTLAFEAFAIRLLQAAGSTEQARKCLRLSWRQAQRMMRCAVEAGLTRRTLEKSDVRAVGLDEKSFLRGNRYATIRYSHDMKCVFEVVEGRSSAAGKVVLQRAIPEALRGEVKAVSMDLSAPYAKAVREELPNARIVVDRFHIAKRFSEAIDQVRRQELSTLPVARRDVLKNALFVAQRPLPSVRKRNRPSRRPYPV